MTITLAELAAKLNAQLVGDGSLVIEAVQTLQDAKAGDISFLANPSYRSQLASTKASAVIVSEQVAAEAPCAVLIVPNPYFSFAKVSQLFDNRPLPLGKIHPSAVVAATAKLGAGVSVGANAVIGEHCIIGDGCEIGAGTVVGDHCVLGSNCLLHANVTLYHDVTLGTKVRIHSGTVIGADGFGFAPNHGQWEKIAQLGGVRIGDDVEIGANTCIDRGALGDTLIGDHVILDNLIQIAHNVQIGDGTAIAACAGISGSTKIGKHCTIAGGVGITGHIKITDGVHLAGMAMVAGSILEPGAYASGTSHMPYKEWRKSAARFRKLDELHKRVKQLEKQQEG